LHQVAHIGISKRIGLKLVYTAVKLFSKNSNLPYVITVPKRHRQTDRQTDDMQS